MLHWAFWFLIVGLIAGLLGFYSLAGTSAEIARVLFIVFIVMFLVGLITRGRGV